MKLLPNGYGYVDLGRLEVGEVDKMFETIKNAPAVILICVVIRPAAWRSRRGSLKRRTWWLRSFALPARAVRVDGSEYADYAMYTAGQKLPEAKGSVYKGKVVMLINEEAISRAEHACLFFEAATDATFVGTPTQGANGDVTLMVLPGNLPVSFSDTITPC